MKDQFDRTKVVLRHLPPAFTKTALIEQIDGRFAGRYNWVSFRPGKTSHKRLQYSRAYLDFKKPDDVFEFAEFFNGRTFVYDKGSQFKTIVEYAPSQRVPKQRSKKDGREGTIYKDPEYLEFLERLAKPVEYLPSAEIQLERREAERAGAAKEAPIVTPLMEFIRQKRAAKSVSQKSSSNGKISRRVVGASPSSSRSTSSKRSAEKKRASASMYVLRDGTKSSTGKEKPTYILVPRRENQQLSDKSISVASASGTETAQDEIGTSGPADPTKKKILLLKGKERESTHASEGISPQLSVTPPMKNSVGTSNFKQSQRRESSGRMVKSILSNKDAQTGQQILSSNFDKDKRPPRSTNIYSASGVSRATYNSDFDSKRGIDDKTVGNDDRSFGFSTDKQERRTRNKDRPDRGVWTLRRSDGSHASDESLSDIREEGTMVTRTVPVRGVSKPGDDPVETDSNNKLSAPSGRPRNGDAATHYSRSGRGGNSSAYDLSSSNAELKVDMLRTNRSGEFKSLGGGRSNSSSVENGSHRYAGRRGPAAHAIKDMDGSVGASDVKPSRRGATSYGSHEVYLLPTNIVDFQLTSTCQF